MSQGSPPNFLPPQISAGPIRNPPLFYPTTTPTEDIRSMIAQLSNYECAWTHGKQVMMGMTGGPKAWIYLNISKVEALGWDEERTQNDPENPDILDFNMCGQRVITVTCRAESMEEGLHPYDMLERVRWSQRSSLAAALRDESHLAIASYGDIIHLGTQVRDNREVKVAVMDLIFNRALNAPEPGALPTTIHTVDGGTQAPGTAITIPGPGDQNGPTPQPPPPPPPAPGENVVTLQTGTYTAQANTVYICDVTGGGIVLNLPLLGFGEFVEVVHGRGSLAVNAITINGFSPQKLSQPAPNNLNPPVSQYIIGGASSNSGGGALDAGTALTWVNGGIPNVLTLS